MSLCDKNIAIYLPFLRKKVQNLDNKLCILKVEIVIEPMLKEGFLNLSAEISIFEGMKLHEF